LKEDKNQARPLTHTQTNSIINLLWPTLPDDSRLQVLGRYVRLFCCRHYRSRVPALTTPKARHSLEASGKDKE